MSGYCCLLLLLYIFKMSERMIELHRAGLLAAGKGNKGSSSGGVARGGYSFQQNGGSGSIASQLHPKPEHSPMEAATATLQTEDAQMKRFLQRLQHQRDDSRPGDVALGPTVPTALSRRMLQKQGAGYLDGSVAAVASASADLFLATVLQQAIACRDQRLKGAEMAKQMARKRKRHKRQYEEDVEERRRRKEERETRVTEACLATIEAAESMKQKSAAKLSADSGKPDHPVDGSNSVSKPKKKKKASESLPLNGIRLNASDLVDDEASYDSIDDEEKYYREYYDMDNGDDGNSENDDDDETMVLRDLARPLAIWHFRMEGKFGICMDTNSQDMIENGERGDEFLADHELLNDEDDLANSDLPDDGALVEDRIENGAGAVGAASTKTQISSPKRNSNKSPDEKKKSATKRPSNSPTPGKSDNH